MVFSILKTIVLFPSIVIATEGTYVPGAFLVKKFWNVLLVFELGTFVIWATQSAALVALHSQY